jgi:Sec-independent protein secretion pathway component TatC
MAKKKVEMSIIEHLEDLRKVLIVSIIATFALAVVAYFSATIFWLYY